MATRAWALRERTLLATAPAAWQAMPSCGGVQAQHASDEDSDMSEALIPLVSSDYF